MQETIIRFDNVKKEYRLGQFGSGTLYHDLQSLAAKLRGKEDPNARIGVNAAEKGTRFLALNGISFEVKKGEALGIIGHNGAGKSTLLKLLCRVTAPTEGMISYNGRIASMLEVGTGFNGEMTGRENIYMNGAILGMTKAEIDSKMEDIIEFSEVRQFIDTPVKRYSSGMYVKLAFSVAAHLDSEIMIMDEVLAVGDMAFQKKCLRKMRDVATKEGRTVLYVSHNMNTIRQLCDRCLVLEKGRIIFDGDVEQAIGIYSGRAKNEFPLHYDLQDTARPFPQHGTQIRVTAFDFVGDHQAIFDRTDPVCFRISFDAHKDIQDLKMHVVIRSDSGDIIGLSQTYEKLADVKSGEHYCIPCTVDFSNLAEDLYSFEIDIFSEDGTGQHFSYDHPKQTIRFKIVDNQPCGLQWQLRYYGHVSLNPICMVEHTGDSKNENHKS